MTFVTFMFVERKKEDNEKVYKHKQNMLAMGFLKG